MKSTFKIVFLFVLCSKNVFGINKGKYEFEKVKNISKTYTVNPDAMVGITNSYGNINVYLWDENKISIQVNIKVSGNNEAKVNQRINAIDVDFLANQSKVTAKTIFENKEWRNNSINYEINYIVKIPKNGSIDLVNKYGNISVDNLNGSSAIVCNYGSLILGEFNNKNNNFDISYSQNSTVNKIDKLNLQSQYSEVDFNRVNQIDVDGNYNSLNFQNVGSLNVDSNYTKIKANTIQKVNIDGNYLTLKLGEIEKTLAVSSNYSNIQFNVSNKTDDISIEGNYSHTKITCSSDYAFNFNVQLGYGSFKEDLGVKYTEKSEKGMSKSYAGYHINPGKSNINVSTNYGSVQLLNK
jgi:hypothetical protein